MRKKVFFVLSSFSAGGAERVFWLLSQGFDKIKFEVVVVLLNSSSNAFSTKIADVRIIDLKTIRASYSFFQLLKLLMHEKPFAVYSTGGHINFLVSLVSLFHHIPVNIARGTNIPEERVKYATFKSKLFSKFGLGKFSRFNFVVCQSKEMLNSWASKRGTNPKKLILISNPILLSNHLNAGILLEEKQRLIIVARMSPVKGYLRLLNVLFELPNTYALTIAGGDGGSEVAIQKKIVELGLAGRVLMLGEINNVCEEISKHNLFVLSSFTEGFPNVVLEALSVGTPVICYQVGGVSQFIVNDFNGFIVEQGDTKKFKECIIKACNKTWDHRAIAEDIHNRFSIEKIVKQYEKLIEN